MLNVGRAVVQPRHDLDLPRVVLIADPGPDPDDVKALLIAAIMHKEQQLQLCAVIANGGQQAVERAALACCLLDHMHERSVPVGIGSQGRAYVPCAHEYDLQQFDLERLRPRLRDGAELLLSVLRDAPPKSLTIVCISSLRDLADVMASAPELVMEKVATVAVMGGLARAHDAADGAAPWRADNSVNNLFDLEAAEAVYTFCFSRGLPMAITSRNAVPLLPMQLAKSFAARTECPVMSYLADAQFLGLEGLWQKLCAGELPARCDMRWYFQTFCGVDAAEFDAQGLESSLDGETDILEYLNGNVKPYDVVALMTVLPATRHLFEHFSGARFTWHGVRHLLLLEPEHMIDVKHVLKLLRDVYHEVVLVTVGGDDDASLIRTSRLARGSRRMVQFSRSAARPFAEVSRTLSASFLRMADEPSQASTSRSSLPAVIDPAPFRRDSRTSSAGGNTPASTTRGTPQGASFTRNLRTEVGCIPLPELEALFEEAFAQARHRQVHVTLPAAVTGSTMLTALLLAACIDEGLHWSLEGCARVQLEVRVRLYATAAAFAIPTCFIGLHPMESYRRIILGGLVAALVLALGGAALYLFIAIHEALGEAAHALRPGEAPPSGRRVAELVHFFSYGLSALLELLAALFAAALVCSQARRSPRSLLRGLWTVGGLVIFFRGVGDSVRTCTSALTARFAGCGSAIWVASACDNLSMLVFGVLMLTPITRHMAQAWIVRISHAEGKLAALAPLLGFGTRHELEPARLVSSAMRTFLPATLSADVLGRMVLHAQSGGRELPRTASANREVFIRAKELASDTSTRFADAFVVHSHRDDGALRKAQLERWAARFRQEHGRDPQVWIDQLCTDMSLDEGVEIQHILVYLARCRSLLVLCGPTVADEHLCVAELWAWRALGGDLGRAQVLPVARDVVELEQVVAGLDAFHVRLAKGRSWSRAEERRIRYAIEIETASRVNEAIRDYTPLATAAAARVRETLPRSPSFRRGSVSVPQPAADAAVVPISIAGAPTKRGPGGLDGSAELADRRLLSTSLSTIASAGEREEVRRHSMAEPSSDRKESRHSSVSSVGLQPRGSSVDETTLEVTDAGPAADELPC